MHKAVLTVLFIFLLLLVGCYSPKSDVVTEPDGANVVARGRHLTRSLAHCGYCHGMQASSSTLLSGGHAPADTFGEINAPNLTPSKSGLLGWSVPQIVAALREAKGKDDRKLSPEAHRGYEWMSDADAVAIAAYLKSLQPIEKSVDRREVGFWERNTVGFFTKSKEVAGSVPSVSSKDPKGMGKYLTHHIARCAECHTSPVSILGGSEPFAGGKEIRRSEASKFAPSLLEVSSSWSQSEIVQYLRTGRNTEGTAVDSRFCPVNFFKEAEEEELQNIAQYLKSLTEKDM